MKLLRETIRKILLEEYELSDEDIRNIRDFNSYDSNVSRMSDKEIRDNWDQRGKGWQGKKNIARDKSKMSEWHELMKTPEGKKIVKDFQSGNIQIMHDITYAGAYTSKDIGRYDEDPFTSWMKRFGKQSRDQISCFVANSPIGTDPKKDDWSVGNGESMIWGMGFYMKGYPAYIGKDDLMTQTLSAIPQTLKKHNEPSGQVKRAGGRNSASVDINDWTGSNETILDNWGIIGIWIGSRMQEEDLHEQHLEDAISTGLPVYLLDETGKGSKIT